LEYRAYSLFQASHATRQDREDPPDQLRGLIQQSPKVGAIHDEQPEIGCRHDRRRSGLTIHQTHLAKTIPGLYLATSPDRSPHRRHTVYDDEKRITRVSNLRDNRPRRNFDDPGEFGDSAKLVLVEPAEERNSLRIAGRLGRANVCGLCLVRIMEGQAISGSWIELHYHLLRSPVRLGLLALDFNGIFATLLTQAIEPIS
jgi:hypothetical protein